MPKLDYTERELKVMLLGFEDAVETWTKTRDEALVRLCQVETRLAGCAAERDAVKRTLAAKQQ